MKQDKEDDPIRPIGANKSGLEVPGDPGRTFPKDGDAWFKLIEGKENEFARNPSKPCPKCSKPLLFKSNPKISIQNFLACCDPQCSYIETVRLQDIIGEEGAIEFRKWSKAEEKKDQQKRDTVILEGIKNVMLKEEDEANRKADQEYWRVRGVDENMENRTQALIRYESLKTKALYRRIYQNWEGYDPTPEGYC